VAFKHVVGLILATVQMRRGATFGRSLYLKDPNRLAFVMDLEGHKLAQDPEGLSLT
jgi:hypothetical protein